MSKVRFPLSDIKFHNIPVVGQFYTKKEVDKLIKDAVDEARKIDEESMAKHNRDATVISMILGFTTLALFVDGLLRLLGITPPFMDIDINIIDKIAEKVESDIVPLIQRVPRI
jgi:hypothetical protein